MFYATLETGLAIGEVLENSPEGGGESGAA